MRTFRNIVQQEYSTFTCYDGQYAENIKECDNRQQIGHNFTATGSSTMLVRTGLAQAVP